MMDICLKFLILIPFYFLGAFPTGFLIAKIHGIDIKSTGSGNVGATNVARTLGKKAGIFTLLGDVGKGALAVFIAHLIFNDLTFETYVAFVTTLGHCFSLPKLKGGKGVATAFGTILVIDYKLALLALAVFVLVFYFSRIVSISSITAAFSLPIFFNFIYPLENVSIYNLMALAFLIIYRHKDNIKRLARGEEKKFSMGKK